MNNEGVIVGTKTQQFENVALSGPDNECYRVTGTTLIGRGWANNS